MCHIKPTALMVLFWVVGPPLKIRAEMNSVRIPCTRRRIISGINILFFVCSHSVKWIWALCMYPVLYAAAEIHVRIRQSQALRKWGQSLCKQRQGCSVDTEERGKGGPHSQAHRGGKDDLCPRQKEGSLNEVASQFSFKWRKRPGWRVGDMVC